MKDTFLVPKTSVEVTLKLKKERRKEFSEWDFTHHGEKKTATHQLVSFFHPSLENIMDTFVQDECESFTIKSL